MSTITLPAQFPSRAISSTKKKVAKLTVWPLVAATFFMVSGGTYGTEDIIHGAGYGLGILLLLLTPLVWSLPTTYMIGELSSALPSEGGYYAWVRRALGNFWGFQEAWLSLVASIFDMAIYPTLFVAYLTRLFPWFSVGHRGVMVGLAVVTVCALMNIAGIRVVAISSLWLFFLLSLPFALIVLIAPMEIGALKGAVTAPTTSSVGLIGGLLICMWNYMGWDNASTIATEVRRPQKTYPRAMLIAVLVVAATYILPFAAMWLTGISSSAFETGSWADLAGMMGALVAGPLAGRIFRAALVLGGMMSAFGMFNALVMSYSRLPLAMAQDGMLPTGLRQAAAKNPRSLGFNHRPRHRLGDVPRPRLRTPRHARHHALRHEPLARIPRPRRIAHQGTKSPPPISRPGRHSRRDSRRRLPDSAARFRHGSQRKRANSRHERLGIRRASDRRRFPRLLGHGTTAAPHWRVTKSTQSRLTTTAALAPPAAHHNSQSPNQ